MQQQQASDAASGNVPPSPSGSFGQEPSIKQRQQEFIATRRESGAGKSLKDRMRQMKGVGHMAMIGARTSISEDPENRMAMDTFGAMYNTASTATVVGQSVRVRIYGLPDAWGFNGKVGVCEDWDPRKERWTVQTDDGKSLFLKEENLKIVGDDDDSNEDKEDKSEFLGFKKKGGPAVRQSEDDPPEPCCCFFFGALFFYLAVRLMIGIEHAGACNAARRAYIHHDVSAMACASPTNGIRQFSCPLDAGLNRNWTSADMGLNNITARLPVGAITVQGLGAAYKLKMYQCKETIVKLEDGEQNEENVERASEGQIAPVANTWQEGKGESKGKGKSKGQDNSTNRPRPEQAKAKAKANAIGRKALKAKQAGSGICKESCKTREHAWSKKCTWNNCDACEECDERVSDAFLAVEGGADETSPSALQVPVARQQHKHQRLIRKASSPSSLLDVGSRVAQVPGQDGEEGTELTAKASQNKLTPPTTKKKEKRQATMGDNMGKVMDSVVHGSNDSNASDENAVKRTYSMIWSSEWIDASEYSGTEREIQIGCPGFTKAVGNPQLPGTATPPTSLHGSADTLSAAGFQEKPMEEADAGPGDQPLVSTEYADGYNAMVIGNITAAGVDVRRLYIKSTVGEKGFVPVKPTIHEDKLVGDELPFLTVARESLVEVQHELVTCRTPQVGCMKLSFFALHIENVTVLADVFDNKASEVTMGSPHVSPWCSTLDFSYFQVDEPARELEETIQRGFKKKGIRQIILQENLLRACVIIMGVFGVLLQIYPLARYADVMHDYVFWIPRVGPGLHRTFYKMSVSRVITISICIGAGAVLIFSVLPWVYLGLGVPMVGKCRLLGGSILLAFAFTVIAQRARGKHYEHAASVTVEAMRLDGIDFKKLQTNEKIMKKFKKAVVKSIFTVIKRRFNFLPRDVDVVVFDDEEETPDGEHPMIHVHTLVKAVIRPSAGTDSDAFTAKLEELRMKLLDVIASSVQQIKGIEAVKLNPEGDIDCVEVGNRGCEDASLFAKYGGFVYKGDQDQVIGICLLKPSDSPLGFQGCVFYPVEIEVMYTITAPNLVEVGITRFAWIPAGMDVLEPGKSFDGGFCYALASGKHVVFPVGAVVNGPKDFPLELKGKDMVQCRALQECLKLLGVGKMALALENNINVEESDTSAWAPVTLPPEVAKELRIPKDAKKFAWAYPSEDVGNFFKYGGFVYQDDNDALVGMRSLKPSHSKLAFGGCFKFSPPGLTALFSVTDPALREMGVKKFAWNEPEAGPAPDGGFIYELASGQIYVFPLGKPEGMEPDMPPEDLKQAYFIRDFLKPLGLGIVADHDKVSAEDLQIAHMGSWMPVSVSVDVAKLVKIPVLSKKFAWMYPFEAQRIPYEKKEPIEIVGVDEAEAKDAVHVEAKEAVHEEEGEEKF